MNNKKMDYIEKEKKVSVVLCTYNGSLYLQEQLDSILSQSYPIYEIIIQDDCSTDSTVQIAQEYAQKYPLIRVFVNKQNIGFNSNFLSAILKAEGDYIALSDQDDIWHPEKIQKQVQEIEKGYYLVFHNSLMFTNDIHHILSKRHKEQQPKVTPLKLLFHPFIPGHECLFSNQILPLVKKIYHQEPHLAYAYVIALACITQGSIQYINEGLVYWRRHERAVTYIKGEKREGLSGIFASLKAAFDFQKRNKVKTYFHAISILPFEDFYIKQIINWMQHSVFWIGLACLSCFVHTKDLYTHGNFRYRIKALFTPLHLIRDCEYLIKR